MADLQQFKHIEKFWEPTEDQVNNVLMNMMLQGKLTFNNINGTYSATGTADTESPWLFIRNTVDNDCAVLHDIKHVAFRLIPMYCRTSCIKVVIKPTTVYELFQVYEIMKELDYHGKVGIDERDFTQGIYGAFCYNETMEDAQERWTALRRAVTEKIGDHVPVICKKGCTEMEAMTPSTNWNVVPKNHQKLEAIIDELLVIPRLEMVQSPWLIRKKFRRFCRQANKIGDLSYGQLEHITGPMNGITVSSVTYHDEWSAEGDSFPA